MTSSQPKPDADAMPESPDRPRTGSHDGFDGVIERLTALRPTLPPTAARIADIFLAHAAEVVHMSVTEVAERAEASEGSVISLCRLLGARGFQQVKIALARDLVQPVQFIHEDLARADDTGTVIEKIFRSDLQALHDTMKVLDKGAMENAVAAIRKARRVELYGIGSAAPIAEDANYRLPAHRRRIQGCSRFARPGDQRLADRSGHRSDHDLAFGLDPRNRHCDQAGAGGGRNHNLHYQFRQIAAARLCRYRLEHRGAGDPVPHRGDDEPHRPARRHRRPDRLPVAGRLR